MFKYRRAMTLGHGAAAVPGGFAAGGCQRIPRGMSQRGWTLDGLNAQTGLPDSTRILPVQRAIPTENWVIHYDPNTPLDEKLEYVQRIGATIIERIDALEIWVVDPPPGFDMGFTFDSDVALVEQDFVVSVNFGIPPNDPDYDRQWALPHIQAETAWREMGDLQPVTVAVIDTGVCMSHEDLEGRVLDNGYDFVDNDDDPEDVFGHGCSVAGIIAANTDNGIGIAGFAPKQLDSARARAGTERKRLDGGCGGGDCVRGGQWRGHHQPVAGQRGWLAGNAGRGESCAGQRRHRDRVGWQQRRQPAWLSGAL